MKEELAVQVSVERMLWFVENFFCYREQNFHEIGIYYYIKMLDENALYKGDENIFWKRERARLIISMVSA